eukprot:Gregarina_sp_Pseudo_9__2890@NODE_3110_length_749_cov_62_329577_g2836_i0_p1_GENE_NODE_3110_length_749_cov_62_329577_g2836_i0NODE_3110_length_749_cov_62_329577_g2836_i0_p1_ORF_typecomplete_len221_score38_87C2/PF00168_30/5_6e18_NODE_3110_length_749_cov_62_329577_g2836_i056718
MGEVLRITVHEGNGLSSGFFGSKDPYVIVRMGAHKFHTTAITNAGSNPKWEQSFTLAYNNEDTVDFVVMDKDTATKDDLMGEGILDLSPLRAAQRMTTNIPIMRKNKPAGTVRVSVVLKGSYPHSPAGQHPPGVMAQAVPVPVYNYQMSPPVFNVGCYPAPQYPQGTQFMPVMPQGGPPQAAVFYPPPQGYPPQGYQPQPGFPPMGYPHGGFQGGYPHRM